MTPLGKAENQSTLMSTTPVAPARPVNRNAALMALLHIPLAQIGEPELQRLIDAKVAEARDIEYKQATYGQADADHAEWLADVSSFANTAGGDLIIGMKATAGAPTALTPLHIDLDREILRLEQIAQCNLQPRIAHLDLKAVPIAAGGQVLLVRVPRSFNPPHRIVRVGKGQHRFWARSSAGKYEPNVEELRALFTLAPHLTERIRDFRVERLARITARATPVRLIDQACLTLHVVPFSSFNPGTLLPLGAVVKNPHPFAPMGSSAAQNRFVNFDGTLMTSNADPNPATQRAYTQLYRTGRIEAVASSITSGGPPGGTPARLTSLEVERLVVVSLVRYLEALQRLGVGPPYAVMVSLIGMRGVHMNVGGNATWHDDVSVLTEDQFHFAEVILESVPASIQECGAMLRPFVEQLANAAGRATSISFGPNGEYLQMFQ